MGGTQEQHPADVFTDESTGYFTDEFVDTDGDGVEDDWVVNYDGEEVVYNTTPAIWDDGADPVSTVDDIVYFAPQVAVGGVNQALPGFYSYEDYLYSSTQFGEGLVSPTRKMYRRRMALPIASCGNENGQSSLDYVGVLCFFLLQEVEQGQDPDVFGQFTPEGCGNVTGKPGPVPLTAGPGPYRIQLYKDTDGYDS
jgi:hypothetical protein